MADNNVEHESVIAERYKHKKKIAFICSGGAVKAAAFHVGVAMALEELGFVFDGGLMSEASHSQNSKGPKISVYAGSSAGCLVATFLSQGRVLDDLVSAFKKQPDEEGIPGLKYRQMLYPRVQSDFLSLDNFFLSAFKKKSLQSPFSTEGIKKYVTEHLISTEKFSKLKSDLFIVTTSLNEAKKVIFGKYSALGSADDVEYRDDVSISDACAASMALPPLYHPYMIQIDGRNQEFFDGELRDPLSAHIGRDVDCDLVICSSTHQPVVVGNDGESISKFGMQATTIQGLYQGLEKRIRNVRGYMKKEKALLGDVRKFFKDNNLSDDLSNKLCEKIESRLLYRPELEYVYITPNKNDVSMFNMPHFSLKRKHTEAIVRRGIRSGLRAFGVDDF